MSLVLMAPWMVSRTSAGHVFPPTVQGDWSTGLNSALSLTSNMSDQYGPASGFAPATSVPSPCGVKKGCHQNKRIRTVCRMEWVIGNLPAYFRYRRRSTRNKSEGGCSSENPPGVAEGAFRTKHKVGSFLSPAGQFLGA